MSEPANWTCECGTTYVFGLWYAAHADEELLHTCTACGAQHAALRYEVTLLKAGKPQTPSPGAEEAK